jgi:hypothetical protein
LIHLGAGGPAKGGVLVALDPCFNPPDQVIFKI